MDLPFPDDYWTLAIVVVTPATVYASIIDYREHRVPNWLNAWLLMTGVLAQFSYEGWGGVKTALGGALVGFAVLIIPWAMHAMGAGDVKLMAAIGAWLGAKLALTGFVVGALIGGVMGVVMILRSGKLGHAYSNFAIIVSKCTSLRSAFSDFGSVKSFGSTTTLLPYGIPLTIGSLLVLAGRYLGWAVMS